jgi:hypothetical protein
VTSKEVDRKRQLQALERVGSDFKFSSISKSNLRPYFDLPPIMQEWAINNLEEIIRWELGLVKEAILTVSPRQVTSRKVILQDLAEATVKLRNQLRQVDTSPASTWLDVSFGDIRDGVAGSRRRSALIKELDALARVFGNPTVRTRRPRDQWTFLICKIARVLHVHGIVPRKAALNKILSFVFDDIGLPDKSTTTAVNNAWTDEVPREIGEVDSPEDFRYLD